MAKAWKDVIASPAYQGLSPEQQAQAQQQYFDEVVAPRVPGGNAEAARAEFFGKYPLARAAGPAPEATTSRGPDGVLRIEMGGTNPPPAPAERNLPERIGRQIGLTARAGVTGLTGLASTGTNAIIDGANAIFGTKIPRADVNATLSAIGLPQPENAAERVAQDVAGAMAGTGGAAKAGQMVAEHAVTPLARGVGALFGRGVGTQLASAATGTAASGIARENGAGAGGQLAAGLLAGMAPSAGLYTGAAAVRGLVRGGEQGRQTVVRNIDAFRRAGAAPTVGQATQKPLMQGIETVLSQSPGGAGVMARTASKQVDDISNTVRGIVDRLAPQAGAVEAGESVARGLEGFKAGVKNLQGQLYGRLDKFLPATAPVTINRTKQALADLNSDIEGAPALSTMFKNAKIQGIERALGSDLATGSTAYGAQAARKLTTLPYESIKKLRTLVGREIDNSNFTSDVPRDKWRALYAALSEDLGDAAKAAGPDAEQAWQWANQFTKSQMGRLDALSSVAGKDTPEKVFNAALMGSAEGDTILSRVVSAIPKGNRRELAAAVINRMGRALPGQQNDIGDAFSTGTFLTNWNRLSDQAKQALFGRLGDDALLADLGNLAGVSSNIREGSRYLANPSGSGPAAARQALLGAIALAGVTGNWPVLGGIAGGVAGTNVLGRLMTNPRAVESLAKKTEVNAPLVLGGLQALFPK